MVRYCLTDADIRKAVVSFGADPSRKKDGKTPANDRLKGTVVGSVILRLDDSLHSVVFAKATPALLSIFSALISRLRWFTPTSAGERRVTAAEMLLSDLITYVGALRIARGFEYREKADEVLGMAIRVLGPGGFLGLLPLNITPGFASFITYRIMQTFMPSAGLQTHPLPRPGVLFFSRSWRTTSPIHR